MERLLYLSRRKDYVENSLDAIILTGKSLIVDMGDHVVYYKLTDPVLKIIAKYQKNEDILYRDKAMKIVKALEKDHAIKPYRTMQYNIVDDLEDPAEPTEA
ncbi:MAG: hypothetical protein A2Y16_05205 [Tenericutes bacterium GWF2_57_13]|nr:MAG: hypothetical protein A2Y16_05205 [Tenericutes bacterium GWF2_57_13]